jgi:hypothetical protein
MRLIQAFAGVPALAVALASTAAGTGPLQPTSAWRVDYTGSQCVALRNYGNAQKPLMLLLKPSPQGTAMRVLWLQQGSGGAQEADELVRWGSAPTRRVSVLSYGSPGIGMRIMAMTLPMAEFRSVVDVPDLALSGVAATAHVALSDMRRAANDLNTCLAKLKQDWRVAMDIDDGGVPAAPLIPMQTLFSSQDYPSFALSQNEQGAVRFTLLIDDKGAVRDCTVDKTSGIPLLDTMSCYVIQQRAKFKPAVGPDGNPRRSAHTGAIVWATD